jgi:hypothetical protein
MRLDTEGRRPILGFSLGSSDDEAAGNGVILNEVTAKPVQRAGENRGICGRKHLKTRSLTTT